MTNSIETKFEADIYILNIIKNSLSLIIYIVSQILLKKIYN